MFLRHKNGRRTHRCLRMRREGYTTQGDAGESGRSGSGSSGLPYGPPRAVIASSVWIPRAGWSATFMTGRGAPAAACAAPACADHDRSVVERRCVHDIRPPGGAFCAPGRKGLHSSLFLEHFPLILIQLETRSAPRLKRMASRHGD